MANGRFLAGIGALIWDPQADAYLILRRAASKDFAGGMWECVTGRVDQGESYLDALQREIYEETGISARIACFLGVTHFYRGESLPENELLGVIFLCATDQPAAICLSEEHDAYQWVTAVDAPALLSATDPSTRWLARVVQQANNLRQHMPPELLLYHQQISFAL